MAALIHYSLNVEVETIEAPWPANVATILGAPEREALEYRTPEGDRWYCVFPCTLPFNERASQWASARGAPVTFKGPVLVVSEAEYAELMIRFDDIFRDL